MENLWEQLPDTPPFVVHRDRLFISSFNVNRGQKDPKHWIHQEVLPEPYLGRPDAPVVLLALHPGFSDRDEITHRDPYFLDIWRKNRSHAPLDYPFYALDPRLAESPIYDWWYPKLADLIADCDRRLEGHHDAQRMVARNLLCVELCGYHCIELHPLFPTLPSQEYAVHLVQQAVERDTTIIVMARQWFDALPTLKNRSNVYLLKAVRSMSLTPKNCAGYAAAVDRICNTTPPS